MNHQQGYSLLEVLLSLLCMTGIACAMLQEQVQSSRFFNNFQQQRQAQLIVNNEAELAYKAFF